MIKQHITASISVLESALEEPCAATERVAQLIVEGFRATPKKRVFLIGNGGSASDAQHIAAEFEGRFRKNRAALPALALTANVATLTAVGNDFGFDKIFSRQVEAHGNEGDLLIALSTSGNSPNILEAFAVARSRGLHTAIFTGKSGGKGAPLADIAVCIPSDDTAIIQQTYLTLLHGLCAEVEEALFPSA